MITCFNDTRAKAACLSCNDCSIIQRLIDLQDGNPIGEEELNSFMAISFPKLTGKAKEFMTREDQKDHDENFKFIKKMYE